ncbi:MAG: 16S rRNA (cytosine(967)-C(5))-methyltransferase [Verrucomicrobiales bacterium]|nr:16S rRNA (cytosine(967)-C(5))-methyltransferase [Verrucomicrobiales bacterium]
MSARRIALDSLNEWEETSRFASDILDELAKKRNLSPPDRGLAQEILYGTIRNLFLLDTWIDELRHGSLKSQTRNILRVGVYQLLISGVAEHAAVNETVNLSRKHERKLVNAVLRAAQRSREDLLKSQEEMSPEDLYSHPEFLIQRWTDQYGEESAIDYCRWNNQPPSVFGRLNELHPDSSLLAQAREDIGDTWLGDDFPGFFRQEGPVRKEWLDSGLIYMQDPSTSLSCKLLDPQPGELILDACAAPGGKTSLLAQRMKNEGKILATDSAPERIRQLEENLERLHVTNAEVREFDWSEPTKEFEDKFDAVLLDVPCSNSGVIRRRVDVRWRLHPWEFSQQAKLQTKLLESVKGHLKPGGRIVYSTCSIDEEENQKVIESSGLQIEKVEQCLPWRDGYDGAFASLLRL